MWKKRTLTFSTLGKLEVLTFGYNHGLVDCVNDLATCGACIGIDVHRLQYCLVHKSSIANS